MGNEAHGVVPTHPIFQGPLPVQFEFTEREKPHDYYVHPGTQKLGEKIKVWKVQYRSFPEVDPGLVSSRENFVETPDSEIISSGINSKGPDSVAIGRHGNFLLWGFSAAPRDMTDSGRSAFVNAICYIQQFDGQIPGPVKATFGGRESLLRSVYWLRSVSDEYIDRQVEQYQQLIQENPPPESVRKEMGDDVGAYFRKIFTPYATRILEKLPADVRERCEDDTERLIRYYEENLEYLRTTGDGGFEVDDDVRQLSVSNRRRELLEKCIAMLEDGEEVELASRVLKRYTKLNYTLAADWRRWFDQATALRFDESRAMFVTQ